MSRGFTTSVVGAQKRPQYRRCESKDPIPSAKTLNVWKDHAVWKRASINTLRCLVGCTLGDFTMLWYLQAYHANLGMAMTMVSSMAAGILTSFTLETVLLKLGPDGLNWRQAGKTATSMSLVSMLAMEATENLVDIYLMNGVISYTDYRFWVAAGLSMSAGFIVPLPYNYLQLKRYGKACH